MSDKLPTTTETTNAVQRAFAAGTPMQQMFGAVLNELGGLDFVVDWAEENPDSFMRLLMAANPSGVPGGGAPGSGGQLHIHLPEGLAPGPLDVVSDQ